MSGGKDSHYQVWYVTKVLKLKPLLVTFNHLDNSDVGIRNLENLITKFGCDHVRFTPNPDVIRRSCNWATRIMFDPFWHEHAGIYTVPAQMAVKYKIPLIIWGEYGFMDLVGMFSHNDFIEMSKKNRQEHGMRGFEAKDFIEHNDQGLKESDFLFTQYPTDEEIQSLGLKGIYLGNYMPWDHIANTKKMIEEFDFETDERQRTFNIYENAETYFNDGVHDYMKYLKYGYGRATDHASQLIRKGYITRMQGAYLVNKWDSVRSSRLDEFLEWVGIDEYTFNELAEKFRDKNTDYEKIYPDTPIEIDNLFIRNKKEPRKGRVFI